MDMVMARERLSLLLWLRPMLSLVIIIMDTLIMDMVVMGMAMDMERGKLKPPLPLMPRLPQDIIMDIIAMAVMEVMATTDMVMERERPRLRLATITDIMEDMVVMDTTDMVMERERPRLR